MTYISRPSDLAYGDTVLIHDPAWAGADGHDDRTAVVIGSNADGSLSVVRTSTARPRRRLAPAPGTRRLSADGAGVGNSLNRVCDLIATDAGIIDRLDPASIRRRRGDYRRGSLSTADLDWLDGRLDALGWD